MAQVDLSCFQLTSPIHDGCDVFWCLEALLSPGLSEAVPADWEDSEHEPRPRNTVERNSFNGLSGILVDRIVQHSISSAPEYLSEFCDQGGHTRDRPTRGYFNQMKAKECWNLNVRVLLWCTWKSDQGCPKEWIFETIHCKWDQNQGHFQQICSSDKIN